MKKIFLTLLLISATFIFADTYKINPTGHYTIPCLRCRDLTQNKKKGYSYCLGCAMWRRYDLEHNEHEYMVYKCKHGHTIYVYYNGNAELK